MIPSKFPLPDGVVEVTDDYQLNLAYYELLQLKPRGTILFASETKEVPFQFFAGENRSEGIFARPEANNAAIRRVFDHLERYPRLEAYITITLLQFRLIFIAQQAHLVFGSNQRTLRFDFPTKILKTHRRKFIRIPFNESFPAQLKFQIEGGGTITRKLKDLSREGMALVLEPGDEAFIQPGSRLKQAVLKVLTREMAVGLSVVAVHSTGFAGIKIIAISEEDKIWIRDCIRILMKQILNLKDQKVDDQIEKDEDSNKTS
jgi:hypothetical protein